MMDAKIASALNMIIQSSHFKKKVSQSLGAESPERGSVFFEEDRSPSWSATTFEWRVLMIQYWIMLIYSLLLGWFCLIICDQDPSGWYSGKSVQIENSWVWSTQNRIRIVRHGNSSKDIDAQKKSLDQRSQLRNFDDRSEKIETGAVVKSP